MTITNRRTAPLPRRPHKLAVRGFLLDISRDRVPTRETLKWLVDILAECGFNEFQPYIEHTFEYTGYEHVWSSASPLTRGDMAWLDGYCAGLEMELVPSVNVFGHMGRWFSRDESLRLRAECPDGYPGLWTEAFGQYTSPPGCLAPTPENARLAVNLVRDIASSVQSRRIHIGGDEPFELGEGKSADEVRERGRDHVYIEHLKGIIDPLCADGYEVLFWADMFRRDNSPISRIPNGATGVVWHYDAPSNSPVKSLSTGHEARLGVPDDGHLGFRSHARVLAASSVPYRVAPGTNTWRSLIGRNSVAERNIGDAIAFGLANRAVGLLLTDWGDLGHWQPLAVSLPSIVRCGLAMQSGAMPTDDTVARRVDEVAGFEPGTGRVIDALGRVAEPIGWKCSMGSPLWASLISLPIQITGQGDAESTSTAKRTLDEAIEYFSSGSVGGTRGEVVAAEMHAAATLARIGLARLEGEDIEDDLAQALELQQAAWLQSSRPGGLNDSLDKFDANGPSLLED